MMGDWKCLEDSLVAYRDISSIIRQKLMLYEKNVYNLIFDISLCSYENSKVLFDDLHKMQREVAAAYYKYEFPLPSVLENFMRDFDRDDIYSRKYWYGKIISGYNIPTKITDVKHISS